MSGTTTTRNCLPVCSSVGHEIVNVTVWRCLHHDAYAGSLVRYVDTPSEPLVQRDIEWVGGPFTADLDLEALVQQIRAQLQTLLAP